MVFRRQSRRGMVMGRPVRFNLGVNPQNRAHAEAIAAKFGARLFRDPAELPPEGVKREDRWIEVLYSRTGAEATVWGDIEPEEVREKMAELADDPEFPTTLSGDEIRVLRPPDEDAGAA